jgi:hypothetical protein
MVLIVYQLINQWEPLSGNESEGAIRLLKAKQDKIIGMSYFINRLFFS